MDGERASQPLGAVCGEGGGSIEAFVLEVELGAGETAVAHVQPEHVKISWLRRLSGSAQDLAGEQTRGSLVARFEQEVQLESTAALRRRRRTRQWAGGRTGDPPR